MFSAWFFLTLVVAAWSVRPWWFWLELGLGTAFVLLVPAGGWLLDLTPSHCEATLDCHWRSLASRRLLLGNLTAAGVGDWRDWREERRWEESLKSDSADGHGFASATGNTVNAGAGAGGGISPFVVTANTPAPTPVLAALLLADPACGQRTNFRVGDLNANHRSLTL